MQTKRTKWRILKKNKSAEFRLSVLSKCHYTSYVNQFSSASLAEGKKRHGAEQLPYLVSLYQYKKTFFLLSLLDIRKRLLWYETVKSAYLITAFLLLVMFSTSLGSLPWSVQPTPLLPLSSPLLTIWPPVTEAKNVPLQLTSYHGRSLLVAAEEGFFC